MLAREQENRWKCWSEKKKRSGKYMNNSEKYLPARSRRQQWAAEDMLQNRQNWFLDILVTNEKSAQFVGGEKAV